ncbi:MAG: hypothetical protein HYW85_01675 [Deltaproteobacteria bacterium]|nr:hypothetical protein [Deltaproteobacteria bacterium]MBI3017398.1 hypothetical protein [Deltaproteobacteria bacterium]
MLPSTFKPWLGVFFLFCVGCGPSLHDIIPEADLAQKFRHNQEKIVAFRGLGRAAFSLQGQKGTVEVLVVAQKPDQLRVETSHFLGYPLTTLTIHKNKLIYYVEAYERYYVGKTGDPSAQKFLPFGLKEKDFLNILLFSKSVYEKFKKHPKYQLSFLDIEEDEKQKLFYPKGFRMTNKETQEYVEIGWHSFDLNAQKFPARLFELAQPPQSRRVELSSSQKVIPIFKGEDEAGSLEAK